MEANEIAPGIFAREAMLPDGWHKNVAIRFAPDGSIASVSTEAPAGDLPEASGPVIPGLPNVHSHAFQRAMAGLAQRSSASEDTFWTWRESMYNLALMLDADQIEHVAAFVYLEMLKAGYTSVGEFHYVHNQPDGRPYDRVEELSIRILAAAGKAGIRLTHLPVLYQRSGFDATGASEHQRRFVLDDERYSTLVRNLLDSTAGNDRVTIGFAAHSLRAVSHQNLSNLLTLRKETAPESPVHIHAAEQVREVTDCLAFTGKRPVEWLLDHAEIGPNWCLIHSTHLDQDELSRLAASGAVVGLCPTTEADLGDGVFSLENLLERGGSFAIGSDSHIRVNASEELRFLEYQARLHGQKRNVLQHAYSSTGESLYRQALTGGCRALGVKAGVIQEGYHADMVVLDNTHPVLGNRNSNSILDTYIFALGSEVIRDVYVHGRHIINNRRHTFEEEIGSNMRMVMHRVQTAMGN